MKRQEAIISSMTRDERRNPKMLNASRRRRIAAGSGTQVQDINRLIKMHQQMEGMIKQMGKMGGKGGLGALFGGGAGAAMPQMPMPKGALPPRLHAAARRLPKWPARPRRPCAARPAWASGRRKEKKK